MSFTCDAFQNLPESCKDGNGLLHPSSLIFTAQSQNFTTKALAGTESEWKADIVAGGLFPYHKVKDMEDLTSESTNWESSFGDIVFLYEGKMRMKFMFYLSVEQLKAAGAARGKSGNMYTADRVGNILGTSIDGEQFRGWKISYVNVESFKLATADTPSLTVIEVQFEEPTDYNENLAIIQPYSGTAANKWYPANLPTITKTVVTQVGSIATDVVTFDVNYKSLSVTDNDGNPVSDVGIPSLDITTFTNFQFVVGGTVTAPSAMTEVAGFTGRYTATVAGIATADTIEILPVATDENLYSSDATAVTS